MSILQDQRDRDSILYVCVIPCDFGSAARSLYFIAPADCRKPCISRRCLGKSAYSLFSVPVENREILFSERLFEKLLGIVKIASVRKCDRISSSSLLTLAV